MGQRLECYAMTADFLGVQEYEYKISATWKKPGGDERHIPTQSHSSCVGQLRPVQQDEQGISHLREFLRLEIAIHKSPRQFRHSSMSCTKAKLKLFNSPYSNLIILRFVGGVEK